MQFACLQCVRADDTQTIRRQHTLPFGAISVVMAHAGGTVLSGLVGLLFRVLLGHKAWIARPLAVATSVGVLALSASPFPPGEHLVLALPGNCLARV